MRNEISEEAKRTLADLPRRKALQRLKQDGATSTPAMQRRLRAIAAERSIPPADFHKLMYKRPSAHAVMDFCEKHKVSYDWLLAGDLKGLQRMKQMKAEAPATPEAQREEIVRRWLLLSPAKQALALAYFRGLIEEQTAEEPEGA